MSLTDLRFVALRAWLEQFFDLEVELTLICGDASFRRYFRVYHQGQSYILADSPIELVPIVPFIAIAKAYETAGLLVPHIIHVCHEQGFVLQTDLGEQQLLSCLTLDSVTGHYQRALDLLPRVASVIETQVSPLPVFDEAFLRRELGIFSEWLLETHLELSLSAEEQQLLDAAFDYLTASALTQPKVGMHRDFHSRNLIISGDELGVIDFQDAVIGPVTYDAVSLLRDCYIKWPQSLITPLMAYHYQACLDNKLFTAEVDFNCYRKWFDLMGMQRHIKAAGIFARLKHRDNKPGYMADIPLTLTYLVDIGSQYPELRAFSQWIATNILPLIEDKT